MTKINRIKNKVKLGDTILFRRKEREHLGIVYKVNENSALVEINKDSQTHLEYETNKTVVGHRNYIVVDQEKVG